MDPVRRNRLQLGLIALLVLVIAALLYKFVVAGSVRAAPDGRTEVVLQPEERALVLGEMRGFVQGLQRLSAALAAEDMQAAAQAARGMGTGKAHDAPAALIGKLPLDFKTLAFGVHRGFDRIADAAEQGATPKQTLQQLSGVLQGCVACHASYRFAAPAAAP